MEDGLQPLSFLGLGSVPFTKGVDSCEKIFKRWELPFWPQYPARSTRENFVYQFLSSFPGLRISDEKVSFDKQDYLAREEEYRGQLNQAFLKKSFLSFEPPSEWALGYSEMKTLLEKQAFGEKRVIKIQVTGPGTVWKSFFLDRVSKETSQRIRSDLVRALTAAGLAQIQRLKFHKRIPLILIDEPIPSDDRAELAEMVESFKVFGAQVGIHVCSRVSWEDFKGLEIDLFHFDLRTRPKFALEEISFIQTLLRKGDRHRRCLSPFLEKSWIAWGIVPTPPGADLGSGDFSALLMSRIREISRPELPIEEILDQSLIAPACGTGSLSQGQDEAIFRSLELTRDRLKQLCLSSA